MLLVKLVQQKYFQEYKWLKLMEGKDSDSRRLNRKCSISQLQLQLALVSRAVHIEVTFSLDTGSFILALRRLVAWQGNIRSIYSNNGSNFIGAEQELKKAYMEMDDRKTQSFLLEQGGDWIRWHNNPPLVSHMGGAWE